MLDGYQHLCCRDIYKYNRLQSLVNLIEVSFVINNHHAILKRVKDHRSDSVNLQFN